MGVLITLFTRRPNSSINYNDYNEVDKTFNAILATQPKVTNIPKFLDDFVNTYFEGDFPIQLWNHHDTKNEPKTNNNMEGYNSKLKKHIGFAHPNIFKAVAFFKQKEVTSEFKYLAAQNCEKPPPISTPT